jgi:RNA polymerase sigma-70 factor (ECF subfamily)
MNPDWNQLDLARRGDEAAWQVLVERHAPRLLRMLFLLTGSQATAQDLIQETFLELFHKGPRHDSGSFGGYISTIAYHLALKEKRRSRNLEPLGDIDPPDRTRSPLDVTIAKEKERILSDVIQSLEEHQRGVLILKFYGGHSYKEIAGILELPLGTVKSRIFNAVKTCRLRMREKGIIE